MNIGIIMKRQTQGKSNGRRFKPGSGNLIKKRLKLVVIIFINQNNLKILIVRQFLGKLQATEARPDNDDFFLIGIWDI